MALLHAATIVPTKGELVGTWLPGRPWAPAATIVAGVSYRLDDPAGEVGIEAFLLTDADGVIVHVPLTYRAEPLADAADHLLGTLEHSVLGTRWVYDGAADPVFAATLAATIATGGTQAAEIVDHGDRTERREPQVEVRGSGSAEPAATGPWRRPVEGGAVTTLAGDRAELVVVRRVGTAVSHPLVLAARWAARPDGAVVAGLRPVAGPGAETGDPRAVRR